jgi:primase-polymerase (primpol)-like protein
MAETLSPAGANSGAEGSTVSSGYDAHIAQADTYDNVPSELKQLRQWVVWRFEHVRNQAKLAKVLYNPLTSQHASSTNAATWTDFITCIGAVRASAGWDGIGFVFSDNDPFAGIDFDYTDDPHLFAQHREWFERLNSYSERSPSKKGLHVIVRGQVPKGINSRAHKIEIYSSGRFFTMTGDVYNSAWIADRSTELNALWVELNASRAVPDTANTPDEPDALSDDEVLERLFRHANGDKYRQLWAGDWLTTLDSTGKPYPSQSEADFALMEGLRFQSASRSQCAPV